MLICVLSILLTFTSDKLLNLSELYYNSLASNLSENVLDEIIRIQKKIFWISYAIIPAILLLKLSIISALLFMPAYLLNFKIRYAQMFNLVLKAEFLFLGVGALKIIWFYFYTENYTLQEYQYFYPLSVLNIVGYENIDAWWIYPFQTLNLFELAYWFILAYLIGKILNISMDRGFKMVLSSYVPFLFTWIVTIMFFTLNN